MNKNSDLQKRMNLWWIIYVLSLIPYAINFRSSMTHSNNQIETWIIGPSGIIGLFAIIKILIHSIYLPGGYLSRMDLIL